MLFPYKYVPHQMEKMQKFIDFIFYEVWCRASSIRTFGPELFVDSPDLKEVMTAFYYGDTQGGDFFYGHVERIYGYFTAMSRVNYFVRLASIILSGDLVEQRSGIFADGTTFYSSLVVIVFCGNFLPDIG